MWNEQIDQIYKKAFQVPKYPHPNLKVWAETIDSSGESNCSDYQESIAQIHVSNQLVFSAVIMKSCDRVIQQDCSLFRPGTWVDYLMNYQEANKNQIRADGSIADDGLF